MHSTGAGEERKRKRVRFTLEKSVHCLNSVAVKFIVFAQTVFQTVLQTSNGLASCLDWNYLAKSHFHMNANTL